MALDIVILACALMVAPSSSIAALASFYAKAYGIYAADITVLISSNFSRGTVVDLHRKRHSYA